MREYFWLLVLSYVAALVTAQSPTDCLFESCDLLQSGYTDNHKLDPAIVGSPSWGTLWQFDTGKGNSEQFLAQPVVFTPPGQKQVVIVASEANNVYVLDAVTGTLISRKYLGAPFKAVDSKCSDVTPFIGVTATPTIDPATSTVYITSKGYEDPSGATTGTERGRYRMWALDAFTLAEKWVRDMENIPMANNPSQVFRGGYHMGRAGLLLLNGVVYSSYAGHCDNFDYSGKIIGLSAATGETVTTWTAQAGPSASTGGGIWMAGGALASDGANIWFATGNAAGTSLGSFQQFGQNVPQAIGQAVVKLGLGTNNTLRATDFFCPYDYVSSNRADQDFGSSGVAILGKGFSTPGVARIAIANGKAAKAYIMNADNLGGFKTGPGGGDGVLQVIDLPDSTFATAGGLPLEGGYIYISGTGSPTLAYKLVPDGNGRPQFVLAGATSVSSNVNRGVGHTVVTSFAGRPGSGLLWITDTTNGNVRCFNAVPPTDGSPWDPIFVGSVPGGAKYQRVVPGDGRIYVNSIGGTVTCFGSPVNQPASCSQQLDFGNVVVGNSSTMTVTCQPLTTFTVGGFNASDKTYAVSNAPTVGTTFTPQSSNFTFNVTWTPRAATRSSSSVTLLTANKVKGFTTIVPVAVVGTAQSSQALAQLTPTNLNWGGIVTGTAPEGRNRTLTITNAGLQDLVVSSFSITPGVDDDAAPIASTEPTGVVDDEDAVAAFTAYDVPSTIAAQSSVSVTINFNPTQDGLYGTLFNLFSNGGNVTSVLAGSAAGPSRTYLFAQQGDGNYLNNTPLVDFGTIPAASSKTLILGIANTGASPAKIEKSKPPVAGSLIYATNPAGDLTEGLTILAGSNQTAKLVFNAPSSQVNVPTYSANGTWVLNVDDPTFGGVQFVELRGQVSTDQVGPLLPDGSAKYKYLGCVRDPDATKHIYPGVYNSPNMTIPACLGRSAATAMIFSGIEYSTECYAGGNIPSKSSLTEDSLCSMPCGGDSTRQCGSRGVMSVFYDATQFDPATWSYLPGANVPVNEPQIGDWSYVGCVAGEHQNRSISGSTDQAADFPALSLDGGNANRLLVGSAYNDGSNMTVRSCLSYCQARGFSYAGTEYGQGEGKRSLRLPSACSTLFFVLTCGSLPLLRMLLLKRLGLRDKDSDVQYALQRHHSSILRCWRRSHPLQQRQRHCAFHHNHDHDHHHCCYDADLYDCHLDHLHLIFHRFTSPCIDHPCECPIRDRGREQLHLLWMLE